jgi:hypothetical protein
MDFDDKNSASVRQVFSNSNTTIGLDWLIIVQCLINNSMIGDIGEV